MTVRLSDSSKKYLKKLDKHTAKLIADYFNGVGTDKALDKKDKKSRISYWSLIWFQLLWGLFLFY